jgi:hypothetical protein
MPHTNDALDALNAVSTDFSTDNSNAHRFLGWVDSLAFMLAGNATMTFVSTKTGVRYTYRIKMADKQPMGPQSPAYFVSLLSGPDNNSDYTYLGMIRMTSQDLPRFTLTRASKMNEASTPVKAFRYVLNALASASMPVGVEVWHEGRCGRCGRKLTVPSSIAAGIGPDCAGKAA